MNKSYRVAVHGGVRVSVLLRNRPREIATGGRDMTRGWWSAAAAGGVHYCVNPQVPNPFYTRACDKSVQTLTTFRDQKSYVRTKTTISPRAKNENITQTTIVYAAYMCKGS